MTFDPTKPVQTRSGIPARILCHDRKGNSFTIAALIDHGSAEELRVFQKTGHYGADLLERDYDLVNVPVRQILYANFYTTGIRPSFGQWHSSLKEAQEQGLAIGKGIYKMVLEDDKIVSVTLLEE